MLRTVPLAAGRPYPERTEERAPWYDRLAQQLHLSLVHPLTHAWTERPRREGAFLAEVARHEGRLRGAADTLLASERTLLQQRLRREGFAPSLVAECFAHVAEAAARTIGQRHYPCQHAAGWELLQGRLVEMATGE